VTDALNPSSYTYEVAPVFTTMEEVVLKNLRALIGYPDGIGDGIFCPGGSLANGCAINLARFKAFPATKVLNLNLKPFENDTNVGGIFV
jgi:glutamate/tyrosine decarboxylase-like PLP-dependent enzyme